MSSFVYDYGAGLLNESYWESADIRIIWVMSNTTADTERSKQYVDDLTTLDEFDGAKYPTTFANRYALSGEAAAVDTVNNQFEYDDTGNISVTSIGVGTRDVVGIVVYEQGPTDDTDSPLIAYLDLAAENQEFNGTASGTTVNITWDSEGLVKAVPQLT